MAVKKKAVAPKKRKEPKTRTERTKIGAALRRIFMYSRERYQAKKRANGKCEQCGAEEPLNCHHIDPIGESWDDIIDLIMNRILCPPEKLICLCKACHNKAHGK